jgi:sec-independent protein translocase protein TatA
MLHCEGRAASVDGRCWLATRLRLKGPRGCGSGCRDLCLDHRRRRAAQLSFGIAMGEFSLLHWLVVLAIIVLLFGAGKLPRVMGDLAKGIRTFKSEMKDTGEKAPTPPAATADHDAHADAGGR